MNNTFINNNCKDQLAGIFEALCFAAHKHRHQKRKGAAGIPYINHPIEVASLLIRKLENPSQKLIIASLLHDILEDTKTTTNELEDTFGNNVLELVMEVTDDMSLSSVKRKNLQIMKAATLSFDAKCIKIADKTCNILDILRTRIWWTRRQKIEYILWAIKVVDQIRDTHTGLISEFDASVKEAEGILKHTFYA